MSIDSILPKLNPTIPNFDLCEKLALTDEELELNNKAVEYDELMTFDPTKSAPYLVNSGNGDTND
jgi:hypothetical protein